ncbi:MAG: hypothetical protein QOI38_1564 [Sphingomonadales bacterium]|nr:hypothetical protein [Sphingomonadales bacterium]
MREAEPLGARRRVFLAAAAAALLTSPLPAQTRSITVPNPGFEDGAPGAPPPGWRGNMRAVPGAPYHALIDPAGPRTGNASVRIESVAGATADGPPFASLSSGIDATPYRGRRLRFTAAVRAGTPPAEAIGLWFRVDRGGERRGFFDNMADRPIRSPVWADYAIEGDVAPDATVIHFGILLSGSGQAWLDDVRLEDIGPASPAASPTVSPAEVLERAIALLREHHINSASADWDALAAEARRRIAGAVEPRDAYPAIQYLIDALGERHTMLRMQGPWGRPGSGAPRAIPMPSYALVDGRYGLVRLPGFLGTPEEAERYAGTLRRGLTLLDGRRLCGWIVDLRDDTGGNMWPMLNGLDPLLGRAPFGSFRSPSGHLAHWGRAAGGIRPGDVEADRPPAFLLRASGAPVAVLLGRRTASSGEMTAIALEGRPGARSFGTPTAGLSTANSSFPLPDGGWLIVTTSYARDRTGHEYAGAIEPDEATPPAAAPAAALRWLDAQPCR